MAHAKQKIISANDLLDGDVVYLDGNGNWTRLIRDAAVAETSDAADALNAAANQPQKVIGPYLIDVALNAAGIPIPNHYRERIRDHGPTVRADLDRRRERIFEA